MRKALMLFALCCASTHSFAVEVTREDLVFLPPFCRGTQLIREVSGDKTPIETYMMRYGPEFWHLHHYCWALNGERKAINAPENGDNARGIQSRSSLLEYSRGNLEYFLARSKDNFILLPEVLVTNARVLYKMGRKGEAIASLGKAIRIRPDYWKAHAKLSDYYRDTGDSKKAIQILEDGLATNPGNTVLLNRLTKLGIEPDPPFTNPPAKKASTTNSDTAKDTAVTRTDNISVRNTGNNSKTNMDQGDQASPEYGTESNPYCRFCAD